MGKRNEELGTSVNDVIGVEITKLEQYNEYIVCKEIIIKCSKGGMNRRIELSGFNKDIPVKVRE